MNLDDVYKKIQDNNINLYEHNINGIKGIVIESNKEYNIFLNHNEIENSDEEFMVATHEYGHCVSGATHKLDSSFDVISRHEYRADKRAVLDFLPFEKLQEAIDNGCQMAWEFAEYLDMPETFVIKAIEHYKCMNLI